jgi:hypothetical protein
LNSYACPNDRVFTGFMLSWWFTVDADFAIRSFHCTDVSSVADVSEVHAASTFRIKVSRVGECVYAVSTVPIGPQLPWIKTYG